MKSSWTLGESITYEEQSGKPVPLYRTDRTFDPIPGGVATGLLVRNLPKILEAVTGWMARQDPDRAEYSLALYGWQWTEPYPGSPTTFTYNGETIAPLVGDFDQDGAWDLRVVLYGSDAQGQPLWTILVIDRSIGR